MWSGYVGSPNVLDKVAQWQQNELLQFVFPLRYLEEYFTSYGEI